MTRRLTLTWPDPRPFAGRGHRPIRLLAASDEADPTLDDAQNRARLGDIDLVVGCGDLSPQRLAFLADAFGAPLVYVRGNHDRRGPWPTPQELPQPAAGLDRSALPGLPILALPWPGGEQHPARRDAGAAWRQALGAATWRLLHAEPGTLVISHAPPSGVGDSPADPYHAGFGAYRFVLDRLAPALWLHGHTNRSAQREWRRTHGRSTVVNATGSVLVELVEPGTF